MKKALIVVALLLAVFVGEILMYDTNSHAQDKAPYVAVTNFALYEISTKLLAGEVDVKKLIPFGTEMHTYTPSVKTMMLASNAKFFIYSGLNMEPWITKVQANALNMSKFVHLNEVNEASHDEHEHHGSEDPHYWLDIDNMIIMTSVLSDTFQKSFPKLQSKIKENASSYISELKKLDKTYSKSLQNCQKSEIVLNHDAFNYLGKKYKFHSHALTGLSPDEQVGAKKMKEISDLVKNEKIKVVFFESFVSDKVAQTIAKETGAKVESLQPLANVTEGEASKGYIAIMRDNLEKLSFAMECE